jgi:hypothetical protein
LPSVSSDALSPGCRHLAAASGSPCRVCGGHLSPKGCDRQGTPDKKPVTRTGFLLHRARDPSVSHLEQQAVQQH